MTAFLLRAEALLWQGPLLLALMGAHLYFTGKLRFVQRFTLRGIRLSLSGRDTGGEMSRLGALSTTLAAAIGTGNIIGVATAVALGGPGAVLWCWLTGLLGMATRYGETLLCLTHRRKNGSGGAMYLLEDRLKKPEIARLFAFMVLAAALTTGAMLQTNAIALVAGRYGVSKWLSALTVTGLAAAGIRGGGKTVARLSQWLVPVMSGLYLLGCLGVLWVNRAAVPEAVKMILVGAFQPKAAAGGLWGMVTAARYGVARGLFTNEAGMGTAPLAACAGPAENPQKEALVAMTAVFWDTVVICGLTGLTVVSALAASPASLSGESLCWAAFSLLPYGGHVLSLCLGVFAFATVVGWCWYGQCGWSYLSGGWGLGLYRLCYLAAAFLGTFGGLTALWSLGSVVSGLLALPNLWCLWKLRREIVPPEGPGCG